MALTPEDVVNKQFQQTKFREGYDQDEVDDFLDEVVVELRRLTQENEELKERLAKAESGEGQSAPVAAAAPVVAAEPVPAPAQPAAVGADDSESSSSLLQLARRLHDEHVREGAEKRDALIAEGHATAARVVAEAEAKQRAQMEILDEERGALERKIDELRIFERDYRQKLRAYIEGHLKDLDAGSGSQSGSSFAQTSNA
ncbi:DivIVA domain-containing protein [Okibacterium endophyticum]